MNAHTKDRFGRRLFLRGAAGVTLGLPFLESIGRRSAAAASPDNPGFAIFMRQANGVAQGGTYIIYDEANNRIELNEPDMFWPRSFGQLTYGSMDADSDRATSELKDHADKLLMVRGVDMAYEVGGCGHARGGLQALTAMGTGDASPNNNSLSLGESIDSRIARELNPGGRAPLTLAAMRPTGFIDEVLSYSPPGFRRGATLNPLNAFNDIMGLVDLDDDTANALANRRTSVNDLVRGQMQSLLSRSELSSNDRNRLDQHFSSIRDLEIRLAGCTPLEPSVVQAIQNISNHHQDGDRLIEVAELHVEVIALGVACGYTHAATLQVGGGADSTEYVINGQRLPSYHQVSHRIFSNGSSGALIQGAQQMHHEIDRIHGRLFKKLLDRLSAYTTESGTLLDDGVCVWMNSISDGPSHGVNNMPYVLAGGCKGALRTGAYVDAGDPFHNKLLSTIATAVGLRKADGSPVDNFGDPNLPPGLIPEMLA